MPKQAARPAQAPKSARKPPGSATPEPIVLTLKQQRQIADLGRKIFSEQGSVLILGPYELTAYLSRAFLAGLKPSVRE